MKITISKSQWEEMGKKAGWRNPEIKNFPRSRQYTGSDPEDAGIHEEEMAIETQEARRLFQQLLISIEPTIRALADRFYATKLNKEKDKQLIDQMRYDIVDKMRELMEEYVSGNV